MRRRTILKRSWILAPVLGLALVGVVLVAGEPSHQPDPSTRETTGRSLVRHGNLTSEDPF
jgi:hypothetical protein